MKNTFGSNLSLTIFGESHGAAIGAVLDGMAAGVPVDEKALAALMDDWASDAMVNGRYWSCPCAVLENMAAKMLDIHGVEVGYYSTDRREADFLVPTSSGFTGVAVRSGSNDRRKSLASLTECGTIDRSVEFGGCRSKDADMYPLYAAGFPDVVFPDAIRRS